MACSIGGGFGYKKPVSASESGPSRFGRLGFTPSTHYAFILYLNIKNN